MIKIIQNIIYVITIILLIIIAYIDFKKHIISDKFNIVIGILGIINILYDIKNLKIYLITAFIVFTFFLTFAVITKGGIGGGDIKLLTALSLIFGRDIQTIILFTYLAAAIVSITMIILKKSSLKSSVALAPFIALGTITYLII